MTTLNSSSWQAASQCAFTLSNEVHVWQARLSQLSSWLEPLFRVLSPEEKQRAHRFHFKADQQRYILAHGLLRLLLSRYLKTEPTLFSYTTNQYGKPYLKNYALHFNLSHSRDYVLIAFAADYPLGVDVEWMRPDFGGEKIARRFFSPQEVQELLQLPKELQLRGFFNAWSRKEAYIKALGKGLAIPLHGFSVSLTPGKQARILSTEHAPAQKEQWILRALPLKDNYAAALVYHRPQKALFLFEINQSSQTIFW